MFQRLSKHQPSNKTKHIHQSRISESKAPLNSMQQQYPSESQSEVELTVQDRQDSNSKQDVFDDDKTDRKTKVRKKERERERERESASYSDKLYDVFCMQIPGVAWLFCGLVAVAFVVAFALIGVALNDDDKEPSISRTTITAIISFNLSLVSFPSRIFCIRVHVSPSRGTRLYDMQSRLTSSALSLG